jgi:hypothetical protein
MPTNGVWVEMLLEHLQQSLVCDPALESWMRSGPSVNGVEACWDLETNHSVQQSPGKALEQSNKHGQIVFIDCSLFLIG